MCDELGFKTDRKFIKNSVLKNIVEVRDGDFVLNYNFCFKKL